MIHDGSIALLIDADNSPAGKIEQVLDELAKYGVINIRRAYGNWKSPNLKGWEAVLHEYAIQPMQQFAYSKGKNATDMAMVVDAMDLLYGKHLEGIALVSSDADFTPLVMRMRANGVKVYGFGEEKTPMPFVNACSRFLYLEHLGAAEAKAAELPSPAQPATLPVRRSGNELKGDTRLVSLLRNSVAAAADDDGWAHLGAVGSHISKQASFDQRNYGYAKLGDLFAAIDLFEIGKRDKGLYVRDRRRLAAREADAPDPE
ncbi:NYN domain-containing protein [Parasulfuritortus cantonensis]|uniref:NYN domain-containing protein n=1 Tax=Parasulfuritortus cantonensis TaxID=2528202 RepID=A0A4R1B7G4_9PROT|nr:NYN domain-containing protein [Parasulfuritortus cantonensis]TCJ11559.1 NYN domain-containing protein [Parasulfuritortus cantonensis]